MLKFVPDLYPGGIVRALYRGLVIAHFDGGQGATQIRWYHLEHGEAGWLTNAPSAAAAEAEISAWLSGLDIVPWDE